MNKFLKFDKWLGTEKGKRFKFIVVLTICTLGLLYHLVGCDTIEKNQARNELIGIEWDKAEMIDVKYYKSNSSDKLLQTFEMNGYKFVIFNNGYGSAMQAIPLNKKDE